MENNLEVKEKEMDRVGDVGQKELALSKADLRRIDVYRRIREMVDAVKSVEKIVNGCVEKVDEPDMVMRAKGVELALKAFGDLKEFDKAGSVTNNFTFATMVQIAHKADREVIGVDKNDRYG